MSKSKKQSITEIIIKELPENYFGTTDLGKIIFKLWCTGRTGSGLRLTEEGYRAFSEANLEFYDYFFNIEKISKDKKYYSKLSILLDKKIKCPFYAGITIKKNQPYVRVYDSKVAMMINLYGSIEDFLKLSNI